MDLARLPCAAIGDPVARSLALFHPGRSHQRRPQRPAADRSEAAEVVPRNSRARPGNPDRLTPAVTSTSDEEGVAPSPADANMQPQSRARRHPGTPPSGLWRRGGGPRRGLEQLGGFDGCPRQERRDGDTVREPLARMNTLRGKAKPTCPAADVRGSTRGGGQALVEFAVVLPFLLLIMLIIIDFGRALYIYTALQNGAREGARFGTVHPTWISSADNPDPDNIDYRTSSEPGSASNGLAIQVTCIAPGGATFDAATNRAGYLTCAVSGSRVEVGVRTQFQAITPVIGNLLPSGGITLAARTVMTIE